MLKDEERTEILSMHSSGSLYELSLAIERAVLAKVESKISALEQVIYESGLAAEQVYSDGVSQSDEDSARKVENAKEMPAPKQEPIGYVNRNKPDNIQWESGVFLLYAKDGDQIYWCPQPAQAAAIPEGWRLVPERPTQEMQRAGNSIKIFAGFNGMDEHVYVRTNHTEVKEIYEAMLSASPKPNEKGGDAT